MNLILNNYYLLRWRKNKNESKKDYDKKSFKKNDAKKVVDSLRKILKSKNFIKHSNCLFTNKFK